jgi:hypothetical protein
MKKIVSEEAVRRAFAAINEDEAWFITPIAAAKVDSIDRRNAANLSHRRC